MEIEGIEALEAKINILEARISKLELEKLGTQTQEVHHHYHNISPMPNPLSTPPVWCRTTTYSQ